MNPCLWDVQPVKRRNEQTRTQPLCWVCSERASYTATAIWLMGENRCMSQFSLSKHIWILWMTYRGRNNTDPEGCERAQLGDGCLEDQHHPRNYSYFGISEVLDIVLPDYSLQQREWFGKVIHTGCVYLFVRLSKDKRQSGPWHVLKLDPTLSKLQLCETWA